MSNVKDNHELINRINTFKIDKVVLNIGCGANKKTSTCIGIDMLNLPGVDIVGNVLDVTKKLK